MTNQTSTRGPIRTDHLTGRRGGIWHLAASSAVAHRADLAGTSLVLAAAGAVVSVTGVLMETGIRAGGADQDSGILTTLASSFAGTALVVLLMVITSTVGLALRQRSQEISVLRTIGATGGQIRTTVSLEIALLALVSVPVGAAPGVWAAQLMTPLLVDAGALAGDAQLVLTPLPALAAIGLVVPVALLAGRLAVRRSLLVPPTTAVRMSAVEPDGIGITRKVSAVVLALSGMAVAGTPAFVPGTVGAASAASSALLLVGAAASAGPWLVHATFARLAPLSGADHHASTRLALGNIVGFSRRLTAAVIPLALVVAIGTMSATVDQAIGRAAHQQLGDAVHAELVGIVPEGTTPEVLSALAADRSVRDVAGLGTTTARVRVDPDLPEGMAWETAGMMVIDPATAGTILDPGVTSGATSELAAAGTVALSGDAAFELSANVGDEIAARLGEGAVSLRVVAVYDRGLGLGGYIVSPGTAAATGADVAVSTVLVRASDSADLTPTKEAAERAFGASAAVTPVATWIDGTTSVDAANQRLSSALLFGLLAFVALGAANAVALTTRNRRGELALLARTGATRRQRIVMVLTEAVVASAVAWFIGTASVIPAAVAVHLALLGSAAPALPLATYAVLSASIFAVAVTSAFVSVVHTTRSPDSRSPRRSGRVMAARA